jgi:hypothetical protein
MDRIRCNRRPGEKKRLYLLDRNAVLGALRKIAFIPVETGYRDLLHSV